MKKKPLSIKGFKARLSEKEKTKQKLQNTEEAARGGGSFVQLQKKRKTPSVCVCAISVKGKKRDFFIQMKFKCIFSSSSIYLFKEEEKKDTYQISQRFCIYLFF